MHERPAFDRRRERLDDEVDFWAVRWTGSWLWHNFGLGSVLSQNDLENDPDSSAFSADGRAIGLDRSGAVGLGWSALQQRRTAVHGWRGL